MNVVARALAGVVCTFLLSSIASGQIAGSIATGALVTHIANELNSTIDKATASGDFLMLRGAQEGLYVLDGFKTANSDLLDKAFEGIGKERQAVLNQIQKSAEDLNAGLVTSLDQLNSMTDQIDTLVRESTFKKQPTVYRYRGGLVIPGERQPVRLRVQGYRLIEGKPYLLFRSKRYEALADANELRVELPRDLFAPKEGEVVSEVATLVLQKTTGWIWKSTTEVRVPLNMVTLPSNLAQTEVQYSRVNKVPHEEEFHDHVSHNSSSHSWNCHPFGYSPRTADRRFDPARTRVTARDGNSRGRLEDVRIKDVGISFRICAKRGTFDRDNGYRHADVSYVETWTLDETEQIKQAEALAWNRDVVFQGIPAGASGLIITVTDFSGNTRTVTSSGGPVGKYATARFDPLSGAVVLTPVIPADVRSL